MLSIQLRMLILRPGQIYLQHLCCVNAALVALLATPANFEQYIRLDFDQKYQDTVHCSYSEKLFSITLTVLTTKRMLRSQTVLTY